ncbi:proto-oncogene Mas-like [Lissotriton helveticus]
MSDSNFQPFNDTNGPITNQTDITLTMLLAMSLPTQIICLLGIAGNGIVLWFLCLEMQRNPFTVYILNLAAADCFLLLCTTVILVYILTSAAGEIIIFFNEVVLFYIGILFQFGYNTSLFLLTAISVERCLSILHPIWYKCHRAKHLSTIVSSLLWTFAIAVTMIECLWCTERDFYVSAPHCTAVFVFLLSLTFGIICPVMILSSLTLIIKVQRSLRKRQSMRLYQVILINVVFFLLTTFPTRLLWVCFYFGVIQHNYFNYLTIIFAHIFCTTVHSSTNPYIYFLVGRKNKRISRGLFKAVLQSVFRSDNEPSCRDETVNSSVSRSEYCIQHAEKHKVMSQ